MAGGSVKVSFIGDAQSFIRSAEKVKQQMAQLDSDAGKHGAGFAAKLEGGTKSVFGLSGAIKGALIGLPVAAFFRSAVHAAEEAEQAEGKLQNTLRNMPRLAGANQKAFDALASSLQRNTKFDDEQIKTSEALLGQFGLTQKQILELTPAVVDLSAKMGIDLETASKAVGKAVEGNTGGLAKLGILIPKTKDAASAYAQTLQGLRTVAGGYAEEEGKTLEGRMAIASHQFDEVKEKLGGAVLPFMSKLADVAASVAEGLSHVPQPIVQIGLGAVAAVGGIILLNKALSFTKRELGDVRTKLSGLGKKFITEGAEAEVGGAEFAAAGKAASGGLKGGGGGLLGRAGGVLGRGGLAGAGETALAPVAVSVVAIAGAAAVVIGAGIKSWFDSNKPGAGAGFFVPPAPPSNPFAAPPPPAGNPFSAPPASGAGSLFGGSAAGTPFDGGFGEAFQKGVGQARKAIHDFGASVNGELATSFQKTRSGFDGIAGGADAAGKHVASFAGMTGKDLAAWEQQASTAFNAVMAALGDLAGQSNLTAGQVLDSFRKQLGAIDQTDKDFTTVLRKGLPQDFAKQLADMGTRGASILHALATANSNQFDAIVEKWRAAQSHARHTAAAVELIADAVNKIPAEREIVIKMRSEDHLSREEKEIALYNRTP